LANLLNAGLPRKAPVHVWTVTDRNFRIILGLAAARAGITGLLILINQSSKTFKEIFGGLAAENRWI
jgi:hypothetical protein